jgi:CRISPR-associated endoribonuclease Cas6
MRLRLSTRVGRPGCAITLNYSHYLSSAIYGWIEASSAEYSAFLHDKGFSIEGTAKRFKHFCFSRLEVPKRRIWHEQLHIFSPLVTWYISMPVEQSLQHLVAGMFEKREFYIEREENKFTVEQVETMPEPKWKKWMKFRLVSPLTVSTTHERNGRVLPEYLLANDERLSDLLRQNILNKYRSLYGAEPKASSDSESSVMKDARLPVGQAFTCLLDQKFIADHGGPKKISNLITIKEGRTDQTKVRAFMCPIVLKGNPELIKLAYESGLGEKNSLGFGMLKVRTSTKAIFSRTRTERRFL